MPRLSQLPSLTTAANDDELLINDVSAATSKKITRGDLLKSPLPANAVNTQAIADTSVTAAKTSFGGNFTLSEVNTGFTWVDGKSIYKKTINFGAMPNATTKSVAHGITGLDYIINYEAISKNTTSGLMNTLPRTSTTATNLQSSIDFDLTNINVVAAANLSVYNSTYVTLYYTKV